MCVDLPQVSGLVVKLKHPVCAWKRNHSLRTFIRTHALSISCGVPQGSDLGLMLFSQLTVWHFQLYVFKLTNAEEMAYSPQVTVVVKLQSKKNIKPITRPVAVSIRNPAFNEEELLPEGRKGEGRWLRAAWWICCRRKKKHIFLNLYLLLILNLASFKAASEEIHTPHQFQPWRLLLTNTKIKLLQSGSSKCKTRLQALDYSRSWSSGSFILMNKKRVQREVIEHIHMQRCGERTHLSVESLDDYITNNMRGVLQSEELRNVLCRPEKTTGILFRVQLAFREAEMCHYIPYYAR